MIMGWKHLSSVPKSLSVLVVKKMRWSIQLLTAVVFTAFSFGSVALGAVPVDTERRPTIDCLNTPRSDPGNPSFILLACFEEVELRLNAFMRSSVSPPPFDQFDLTLIALHRRATDRAVAGLRDLIQRLVQGSENERQVLADFETGITEGLLLEEAAMVVGLMRASGESGDGDAKDKGKEVQESIKKIIEKALDSVLGKQFSSLFEVIDELVRLFVKT
jgi:hypothetical protein